MNFCDMRDKVGIVMGVANKWSIAWGVTKVLDSYGARMALTHAGEPFGSRVNSIVTELQLSHSVHECNVKSDESIASCFQQIESKIGKIDFLVHSIAFAQKEFLKGEYYNVSRDAFAEAMDVSCYSFTAAAREAAKIMNDNGSMITMSYYGAEKWIPHYNVMGVAKAALECSVKYLAADLGHRGIRVNAISPGPIKTLSATGIDKFDYIGEWNKANSPLMRLVSIDDVGKTAAYLISDLSRSVTGELIHVDGGYHIVGMKNPHSDM